MSLVFEIVRGERTTVIHLEWSDILIASAFALVLLSPIVFAFDYIELAIFWTATASLGGWLLCRFLLYYGLFPAVFVLPVIAIGLMSLSEIACKPGLDLLNPCSGLATALWSPWTIASILTASFHGFSVGDRKSREAFKRKYPGQIP